MGIRIGIDGRYLQDHFPGIGRYTFHLIRELAKLDGTETYVVFYCPSAANNRFDLRAWDRDRIRLWPVDLPPLSLSSQAALPLAIRQARIDLFHSPHYALPLLTSRPLLATIHDTIPLRDRAFFPSKGSRFVYRLLLFAALLRSKAVIADSAESRGDLVRLAGQNPQKLNTIYLGVDIPDKTPLGKPRRQHILYVGTNKPHKNLPRLVEAYARAKPRLPLVVAGGMDPRYPQAQMRAEALGLSGMVRFLGHVGEDELDELYRSAALFVFPSLAEGFGLPALEAMAYGVPVVASSRPAVSEVVGDAAVQIDPLDVEAMASAMTKVLDDAHLALHLSRRGADRAALFPWSKTAEGCLRLYRQASR